MGCWGWFAVSLEVRGCDMTLGKWLRVVLCIRVKCKSGMFAGLDKLGLFEGLEQRHSIFFPGRHIALPNLPT